MEQCGEPAPRLPALETGMKHRPAQSDSFEIEVHLEDEDPKALLTGIGQDLLGTPREISPRFFYDDHGSRLFEEICTLPEYYQTRTERAILNRFAAEIARETGARELVELGSGAATKTRVLLTAMARAGTLRAYLPFDVNAWIVRRTAMELLAEYDGLRVHGVVGDFLAHLDRIPAGERRIVAFLGGTLGNLDPANARAFTAGVAAALGPDDFFLLGVDLIKDPRMIEAAYNDSRGLTARFNRNALAHLNRIARGNFDPARFDHRAFFNEEEHRIEMWLHATEAHEVSLLRVPVRFPLDRGEGIRTELSVKYNRGLVRDLIAPHGLRIVRWFTDPADLFALTLIARD